MSDFEGTPLPAVCVCWCPRFASIFWTLTWDREAARFGFERPPLSRAAEKLRTRELCIRARLSLADEKLGTREPCLRARLSAVPSKATIIGALAPAVTAATVIFSETFCSLGA